VPAVATVAVEGSAISSSVTFTAVRTGAPTDPPTVAVQWEDPTGAVGTYTYGVDSEVVRDGAGAYHMDRVGSVAGGWTVQWVGENVAVGFAYFQMGEAPITYPPT
jgi:hypothetical protein